MLVVWRCLVIFLLLNVCGSHDSNHGSHDSNPLAKCNHGTERHLYISTADGILTAVSEQGEILWSYSTSEPLFTSSLSQGQMNDVPDLIPSMDGGIYHWDGTKLNKFPFMADDLIDHTHLHKGRGSFLTGSKTNDVVGINIKSGKPIYECHKQKCIRHDNQSLIQRMDVLKLSISRVKVLEASDHTGEEMWNFTVGDMTLMLIEGVEEEGEGHSCHLFYEPQWELHVDILTGIIYTTDRFDHHELWRIKLEAPVIKAWFHEGGKLEQISLFDSLEPSLMLVHYNSQYYLQSVVTEGVEPTKRRSLTGSQGVEFRDEELMNMVNLKQYLPAMELGENSLKLYNEDTFLEMCTEGPYGLAVYFNHYPLPHQDYTSGEDDNSQDTCLDNSQEECIGPTDHLTSSHETSSHWLILKLFSILKYTIFGVFVLLCNKLRRYFGVHRARQNSTDSNSSSLDMDERDNELLDQLVGTIKRTSSITVSDSATTPTLRTPSFASSSTETLVSLNRCDSIPEPKILARFGSDYELMGRLGNGGFGIVYHVQNKTDGGEYAVKRIKLPSNKPARDKVMREVRALAQLDHPRIVRYFNSWVEKAPVGWSEMEEWLPLSRRPSYIQKQISTHPVSSNPSLPPTSLLPPPPPWPGQTISPCPSLTSLNHTAIHSVIPPAISTDSRSSSFVIEFVEDSQNVDNQFNTNTQLSSENLSYSDSEITSEASVQSPPSSTDGCFSRDIMINRDEFSSTASLCSTDDDNENRDSITDLTAEPPTYLFIQMQLCQKESLKDWLRNNVTNRNHGDVMHFFEQILDAVVYVHDKGMMHRDLKPSNIFFSLDGHIKIGDFGLVTTSVYGGLQSSYLTLNGLSDDRQHTGNLGSHFYMSPELISGLKYDQKVDIFSLGIIFFELHYPFLTNMERAKVLEDVRKQKFPSSFVSKLPHEAELVRWLVAHHATDRPSVKEIFSSDRFKELKVCLKNTMMGIVPKL